MKYTYACKKVSLNDSIKAYTEKKIAKLEKYFREDTTAFVTFSVEKDHRCTVEITVRSGGALLRAQTEAPDGDMRGAVDAAVGYIERQKKKNKTRLSKRLRSEGFPPPAPASDFEVAEEKEFPVVRTKRFAVKPMSTEEAILQMNLLDHSFFVFRSSEDDSLSIVYRRKRGGYGLIVTGACRGEVWNLSDVGAQPCCPRQDFLGWFELWLDNQEQTDYFKDYPSG